MTSAATLGRAVPKTEDGGGGGGGVGAMLALAKKFDQKQKFETEVDKLCFNAVDESSKLEQDENRENHV